MELFIATAGVKDPVELAIIDRRIFMLRHGYLAPTEPNAYDIRFNNKLRDCYHPWSAKAVGETFGEREYDKYITLHDYLHSPVDMIENILEGVVKGKKTIAKLKKKAMEDAARQSGGISDPGKAALNHAMKEDKN